MAAAYAEAPNAVTSVNASAKARLSFSCFLYGPSIYRGKIPFLSASAREAVFLVILVPSELSDIVH
jgi:hypothetical protein